MSNFCDAKNPLVPKGFLYAPEKIWDKARYRLPISKRNSYPPGIIGFFLYKFLYTIE